MDLALDTVKVLDEGGQGGVVRGRWAGVELAELCDTATRPGTESLKEALVVARGAQVQGSTQPRGAGMA